MERKGLSDTAKKIAWGYVLLHININLGTLNILPNWLGYIFILGTLTILGEEEPSVGLLRPLGILLACWEGLLWLLALLGMSFDSTILAVIAAAASLYFHFQLLTNLARISENHCCTETKKLLRLRSVRTVLITLLALPFDWQQYVFVSFCVILVNVVVAIWICSVLFSLSRSLSSPVEESPAE